MLSKLRAVGGVVLIFSLACAGGEASEQERTPGGGQTAEPSEGASAAQAAEGTPGAADSVVLGNGEPPEVTEGSNTNWRPSDPEPGGASPPSSGSAPPSKPPSNGSPGTLPVATSGTPSGATPTASSGATNTASSGVSTPSPVAP